MKKSSYLNKLRRKTDLQAQLLISHVLAMALGLLPGLILGRLYTDGIWTAVEAVIGVLLSVALMSLSTGSLIVQPVKSLEKAIERFDREGKSSEIEAGPVPELRRLALAFDSLTERLELAGNRRYELIGALTHEIYTPLTVLTGDLEMLQQNEREPTPELYDKLLQQTAKLTRLTKDLSTLSKGELGQLSINRRSFSMRSLLQNVQEELTFNPLKSSCQIRLDCPANLPNAFADPDRVGQILTNLISNAIRYAPGGTISVRAWTNANYLWIAVADDGIGIAPDEINHVFDAFWRSNRARHLAPEGRGIGLSLVQQLVRLQGGQIDVESELGKGSTFRFSIPLA